VPYVGRGRVTARVRPDRPFPGRAALQATGPIERSSADRTLTFPSSGPAPSFAASGPMTSAGWSRNVIVAKRNAAPLASRSENPPIGDERQPVAKLRLCSA
jgi:hypothetical protein